MSEQWRAMIEERGTGSWLRERWTYGSVLVLDLDHIICSPDFTRGLVIEWKHGQARDKTWKLARHIADRCGWYAALFEYETETGSPLDLPIRIDATTYRMGHFHGPFVLDEAWFDAWVCDHLGALPL